MDELQPENGSTADLQRLLHDLKQPLNVIRLATGNIRNRIVNRLEAQDGGYLDGKLDRIEEQVKRAADLIEVIMTMKE